MKYLLTVLTVLFAGGYACGAERMGGLLPGSDQMITNDDLQNMSPNSNSSTINQMPATEGSQGSAAGGTGDSSDGRNTTSDKSDQESKPADRMTGPDKGTDAPDPGSAPPVIPGHEAQARWRP